MQGLRTIPRRVAPKFKRYAKRPRIWGLHSYGDTNHFKPLSLTATRQLLRKVRGEVWLTETGGIVRFSTRYRGGKRAEARELLAPIYGWFTEGFDTADLQEAKELLEELA